MSDDPTLAQMCDPQWKPQGRRVRAVIMTTKGAVELSSDSEEAINGVLSMAETAKLSRPPATAGKEAKP